MQKGYHDAFLFCFVCLLKARNSHLKNHHKKEKLIYHSAAQRAAGTKFLTKEKLH